MLQLRSQGADVEANIPVAELVSTKGGLMVFSGDHSRAACTRLAADYPNGRPWKLMPIEIFIGPPLESTYRILRLLGNQDNYKAGVQLRSDFATLILQLHRHYSAICQSAEDDAQLKVMLREMKADYAYSLQIPVASVGQQMQLAMLTGRAWAACEKILLGDTRPYTNPSRGKGKAKPLGPPKSSSPFTTMGGLSEEVITALLEKVVLGKLDWQGLRNECLRIKAVNRIKLTVIETMTATNSIVRASVDQAVSWKMVVEQHPRIGCKSWVNQWVPVVVKIGARAKLPPDFYTSIERLSKEGLRRQVRVCEFVICVCPCRIFPHSVCVL